MAQATDGAHTLKSASLTARRRIDLEEASWSFSSMFGPVEPFIRTLDRLPLPSGMGIDNESDQVP